MKTILITIAIVMASYVAQAQLVYNSNKQDSYTYDDNGRAEFGRSWQLNEEWTFAKDHIKQVNIEMPQIVQDRVQNAGIAQAYINEDNMLVLIVKNYSTNKFYIVGDGKIYEMYYSVNGSLDNTPETWVEYNRSLHTVTGFNIHYVNSSILSELKYQYIK